MKPSELDFELTTIERLKALGYGQTDGGELREKPDFQLESVVLNDALRRHLEAEYPHLPPEAIETAIQIGSNPEGIDLIHRNMFLHDKLTRGFEVKYKTPKKEKIEHVYLVNWNEPTKNDFRVVSQLPIRGTNDRRPDLIIYVNGLPLVVFELKNPYDESPTVEGAYNQIQHYTVDIPLLFEFNAFTVVSDGKTTLHGMFPASREWFSPWKSIDGKSIEPGTISTMKTLIEGLFPKERLLEYIRHFIVFESVNETIIKKGAKYHQFFGVRFAVEEAVRATKPDGDRRIGVIWHTQGSGKSLSMIFFVGILRRKLKNPTFVVQVDRTDLDEQLFDFFVAARSLVGEVSHAETVEEMRNLLEVEGGGIIFTTLEKFRLQEGEVKHPVLSDRRNIVVIADEAHRTQYGLTKGFAYQLREALPQASFIGFTGTPISLGDRDTQAVFGDTIHRYDIPTAQADKAVVPIYYEARLVKLHLVNQDFIDQELEEITEGDDDARQRAAKWATVEAAAGTEDRLKQVAKDILTHFDERQNAIEGKALVVCMSRRICVALFEQIVKLRPEWNDKEIDKGQVKVVMTGDLSRDPKEWNEAGHITTKEKRERLKARFKDPKDPLKMVIVRDMWLTGTDIPCLHTMYVDKPMRGHNVMQAVARVNRVFRDKPGGLVVDFIGIGASLKEAARRYTAEDFGNPVENIDEEAKEQFLRALEEIRKKAPKDWNVTGWRKLSKVDLEDFMAKAYGYLSETDERRDEYLEAEKRLSVAASLVMHLDDCRKYADEIVFHQMVRAGLKKTVPGPADKETRERAVRELIDRSILTDGVIDIYKAAGIEKPDISILDERFLEEFKSQKHQNLRLRLLEKLLRDEISLRSRKNLRKYRSFKDMLEDVLRRYHSNALTAAEVVQAMIKIREEMMEDEKRKTQTGLDDEELAFYDAISTLGEKAYDMPFLCGLVREVVQAVRKNLKVDWTLPHRENIKAEVRAAVKMVLRKKKIKSDQFDFILGRIMEQAEALYENYPVAV